jgi:hypothetical protein
VHAKSSDHHVHAVGVCSPNVTALGVAQHVANSTSMLHCRLDSLDDTCAKMTTSGAPGGAARVWAYADGEVTEGQNATRCSQTVIAGNREESCMSNLGGLLQRQHCVSAALTLALDGMKDAMLLPGNRSALAHSVFIAGRQPVRTLRQDMAPFIAILRRLNAWYQT